MVSLGPNNEPLDFMHMADFVDYRGTLPVMPVAKNTLWSVISQPQFSKFARIVINSGYAGKLNEEEADFTMFIPEDTSLGHIPNDYFLKMDDGLSRQILRPANTFFHPHPRQGQADWQL